MNLILLATGSLVNVRGRVLFLCVFAFFFYLILWVSGRISEIKSTSRWFQLEINWETLNTVLYKVMYNCEKSFS